MVYPADVVLFEGILVFYSQEVRDMFHLRLFVDTDSDVRLSRRGRVAVGAPRAPGRGRPQALTASLLPQFSGMCTAGGTWSRS